MFDRRRSRTHATPGNHRAAERFNVWFAGSRDWSVAADEWRPLQCGGSATISTGPFAFRISNSAVLPTNDLSIAGASVASNDEQVGARAANGFFDLESCVAKRDHSLRLRREASRRVASQSIRRCDGEGRPRLGPSALGRTVRSSGVGDRRSDVSHRHRCTDRVDEMTRPGNERRQQVGLVERDQNLLGADDHTVRESGGPNGRSSNHTLGGAPENAPELTPFAVYRGHDQRSATSFATAVSTSSGRPT